MKRMDDNNNWLGFSLSPHMTMEVAGASTDAQQREHDDHRYHHRDHHHDEHQPHGHHHGQYSEHHSHAVTTGFYQLSASTPSSASPHDLSSHVFCYGVVAESSGGFHAPLSAMPLKSDGSLCIMEALSRSQPMCEVMVPNSSPKLEDFLGGAARETMALSLDSLYYQNTQTTEAKQQEQGLQMHYYSGFSMYQPTIEADIKLAQLGAHCDSQIPQMGHHENDPMLSLNNQMLLGVVDGGSAGTGNGHGGSGGGGPNQIGSVGCGDLQSLSLSMSPGSQSSCVTAPPGNECLAIEDSKKKMTTKICQKQTVHRKSIETFGQRTSQYRGVTRHRWTGRYEAHLWDNSCKKEGQTRKGRQVYLGGYDMEEKAARAYDLAALKYWGPSTHINFPLENYREELEEMKNMTRQEYVAHLRRKSSGFSRGASIYRGVTRHHQHGRWQARIGRVAGNKDLYLGTFSTQEEAAEAYDVAAIKFRGVNAVTNFDISRYDAEKIMASNTLLAGELARRNKEIVAVVNHIDTVGYNAANQLMISQTGAENPLQFTENGKRNCDNVVNYQNAPVFSTALETFVGIDGNTDGSGKFGAHLSNASSLVTSLSSSREASPDKNGSNVVFDKQQSLASRFMNPGAEVANWFPAAQYRPPAALSITHLPVFAAWNDI